MALRACVIENTPRRNEREMDDVFGEEKNFVCEFTREYLEKPEERNIARWSSAFFPRLFTRRILSRFRARLKRLIYEFCTMNFLVTIEELSIDEI